MQEYQFQKLCKAARAGVAETDSPAVWNAAIDQIAKSAQRDDETFEMAYSRVTLEDPDARALMRMYHDAVTKAQMVSKRGRPREEGRIMLKRGALEKALSDAAMMIAERDAISYERAFCKVLDTAEGRALYRQMQEAEV